MARYHAEMNTFEYCASLRVSHPSLDLEQFTAALGVTPTRQTCVGTARRHTPNGEKELEGTYTFNHWCCELPTVDGERLTAFLWSVVKLLSLHNELLTELAASGGESACFVGLFTKRNCDEQFPCELLSALANLKIGL